MANEQTAEDHARVKAGLETYVQATERLTLLEAENDTLKTRLALTERSLEHYQQAHAQATAERDHYMRLSTELEVALRTAGGVIADAASAAAQAPYRRNGHGLSELQRWNGDDDPELKRIAQSLAPAREPVTTAD